jgi:hypothetical protein
LPRDKVEAAAEFQQKAFSTSLADGSQILFYMPIRQ